MLGTNLSHTKDTGEWTTDTNRLILMDRRDFNKLGLGLDDLIEAYIQVGVEHYCHRPYGKEVDQQQRKVSDEACLHRLMMIRICSAKYIQVHEANILVVTDHTTHTESNSVYQLSHALRKDIRCGHLWVCSKGLPQNSDFFNAVPGAALFVSLVDDLFAYDSVGSHFERSLLLHWIVGQLMQSLSGCLSHWILRFCFPLKAIVPPHHIINSPAGIVETASKAFLMQVSYLCPEPHLCQTIDEAMDLSARQRRSY